MIAKRYTQRVKRLGNKSNRGYNRTSARKGKIVNRKSHKDNMTPEVKNNTEETPKVEKVTVKRSLFDLAKFERRSVEKEIDIKEVKTMDEVLEIVENDDSKLVSMFNKAYRRDQISTAKKSIMTDDLVSPKVVSGFVNQFKPMFPLDSKKVNKDGDPTPEAKQEQTQKIYAFIRSQEALLSAIRSIAAATIDLEDDEENDNALDTE